MKKKETAPKITKKAKPASTSKDKQLTKAEIAQEKMVVEDIGSHKNKGFLLHFKEKSVKGATVKASALVFSHGYGRQSVLEAVIKMLKLDVSDCMAVVLSLK